MSEDEKLKAWRDCLERSQETACFLFRMGMRFDYELVSVRFLKEDK